MLNTLSTIPLNYCEQLQNEVLKRMFLLHFTKMLKKQLSTSF